MEDQIIGLIQKNNKMSTEKMAMILGVSSKTVKRRIKQMDHVNYIGRGSNGHCWRFRGEVIVHFLDQLQPLFCYSL